MGELKARHVSSQIPNGGLTVRHVPGQTPVSLRTAAWGNVLARRADVAPFVSSNEWQGNKQPGDEASLVYLLLTCSIYLRALDGNVWHLGPERSKWEKILVVGR